MEFLIVSGLSGGGKSRAADVLEDLDFYCVDNMPTALLTKFAELCLATRGRYEKGARVTDIRRQESVSELFAALGELGSMGVHYRILFVEASESAIVRRYKESRRPHPLQAESGCSLPEAVRRESELLAPVRALCPDASAAAVPAAVRRTLDALREDILSGAARKLPGRDVLCALAAETVHRAETPALRPVINATGVVLHTNLGRARLSGRAAKAAADAAEHYSTLEYDVKSGGRGSRTAHA